MENYSIDGIGYDLIGQQAYVYANGQFYPLDDAYYNYLPEDEAETTPNTNQIYSKIWASNENAQPEEDETYYVIEDDFAAHHYYFQGDQKYKVGEDCILELDGFTEKGFLKLKEVKNSLITLWTRSNRR